MTTPTTQRVVANPNGQVVNTVTFTPDSLNAFSGDQGSDLRRWNVQGTTLTQVDLNPTTNQPRRVTGRLFSVVVSKDGRWVVTGEETTVTVWDATNPTATPVRMDGHGGHAMSVDITEDAERIASASWDANIRVFNRVTRQRILGPLPQGAWVAAVKFSPSGHRLAVAAAGVAVRVYNVHPTAVSNAQQGVLLFEIPVLVTQWPITPLAWSPDNTQLFAASPGRITRLNISSGARTEWTIHSNDARASIVTNGVFVACSAGRLVSFWDVTSGSRIDVTPAIQHTADIYAIALSPNERHLACGFGANIAVHSLRDILPTRHLTSFIPFMRVSDEVLAVWNQSQPLTSLNNAEAILSGEITQSSNDHHPPANRSIVRSRLGWPTLDADESLRIQPSPIGYIARAVAFLNQNKLDDAEATFNMAFHDCEPSDNRLLLLLQAILMFECKKESTAISRVESLVSRGDNAFAYAQNQVLGSMRMRRKEYGLAITAFDRARYSDGRSTTWTSLLGENNT